MAVRYDEGRKRWTVEFEQSHVRVFRRLPKGATEPQAKALEVKLRREIFDRETLQKVPALTIETAINQWLTEDHRRKNRKKMLSEAKQWEGFVKGKLLREMPEVARAALSSWTSETAQAHASGCGRGASPKSSPTSATINRRLAMMKAVCRHAYKQGRIAENLSGRITMLREDNKRERYLTRAEVQRIASCVSGSVADVIRVAAYTGLRAGELVALRSEHIGRDTLTVASSKNGKPRIVPVPRPALGSLSALPLECSYWELRKQFLAAAKKARIRDVTFHDLRHTCASWLINAGVDIYTLSKILGHSSIQTTQRYAHLYQGTLKEAMGRLK